jgi:hypothetical protein
MAEQPLAPVSSKRETVSGDLTPQFGRVRSAIDKLEDAANKADATTAAQLTPVVDQATQVLKSLVEIEKSRAETRKRTTNLILRAGATGQLLSNGRNCSFSDLFSYRVLRDLRAAMRLTCVTKHCDRFTVGCNTGRNSMAKGSKHS